MTFQPQTWEIFLYKEGVVKTWILASQSRNQQRIKENRCLDEKIERSLYQEDGRVTEVQLVSEKANIITVQISIPI